MLSAKKQEETVKGFANHRRIEILSLLLDYPYLSVEEISEKTQINYKTASGHIKRLETIGLIRKQNHKTSRRHSLTQKGKTILKFLRTLE